MFTLIMFTFIKVQGQWIVWDAQNTLSNEMLGRIVIDGEEIIATAIVTSNTVTESDITYRKENNNVLRDSDGININDIETFKNSLDVSQNNEFVYSEAGQFNYPNIISITFNKDVVIGTLSLTDINQYPERWTDSYIIEGYDFDRYEKELGKNVDVTNQGVVFGPNYTGISGKGNNYIRHFGTNVLKAGTPIKIKYIGRRGRKGGFSQSFKYEGISNQTTAFAIKVNSPICYAQPTKGETLHTFVGVSTLNRNTENWLPERLGAYLVLESTNKGFVITRNENPDNILQPKEGMIVWDTTANCLKLYSDKTGVAQWNCIEQGCNK